MGIIAAAVVVAAVGAPATAMADNDELCPGALACIYVNPNWVGLIASKDYNDGMTTVTSAEDNITSSWENFTSSDGAWYDEANGAGNCFPMEEGTEDSSIGWPSYDKLTSWSMNDAC